MARSRNGSVPKWLCTELDMSRSGYVPKRLCPEVAMSRNGYVPKWLCPETVMSRSGYVPKRSCPEVPDIQRKNQSSDFIYPVPWLHFLSSAVPIRMRFEKHCCPSESRVDDIRLGVRCIILRHNGKNHHIRGIEKARQCKGHMDSN